MVFNIKKIVFKQFYLFLGCAGSSLLHRLFSSCVSTELLFLMSTGLLFLVVHGLLITVASLVKHRL